MFELNLIREKTIRFENTRKYIRYFRLTYLGLSLAAVALLGVFGIVYMNMRSVQKVLSAVNTDINGLKDRYGVRRIEQEWGGYQSQTAALATLVEKKTNWSGRLREVVELLPPEVSIEWVRTEDAIDGSSTLKLDLVVSAEQNKGFEIINAFVKSMESSKYFSKGIQLDAQERMKLEGREFQVFKLTVPLPKP